MNSISNDIVLGYHTSGNPVGLPLDQLNRHTYICGKSGSGKSKLLEHTLRELIRRWPWTREGLLLIDPHAELYESLVSWMAASGFDNFPVIPLDLRSDWICSLHILRPQPEDDPAPLIHAAVRAILHGWKQADATDTPRLTKWLTTLLATLYSSQCTLLEALDIIRSREIRSALALRVEDAMAKSVWIVASKLTEAAFQEELESTMNRLGRFLSTQALRLAFSQSDVSLDMRSALAQGHIVLAALSTEGSKIAEEDAAVVGSLLVNEVWSAAKHRGKRSGDRMHRRFIVAIDEFQEYISPVIAQSLAQLRGMNVGFIMAHQSPQQLLDLGPGGRQVLNAAISNTTTQVLFQTGHPADLDLMTPWLFRNNVDVDQVKHQHYTTKVLGYRLEYHDSTSHSTSQGVADTENWSTTESSGTTSGVSHGQTESVGVSHSSQRNRSIGTNAGLSHGHSQSHAESTAQSEAAGTTVSRAAGHAHQRSDSTSENRQLAGDSEAMLKIVGAEPTHTFDAAYRDEEGEFPTLNRSMGTSAATGTSDSESESTGVAATRSTSSARAEQDAHARSESHSSGMSESASDGESDSVSLQRGESRTTSESSTTGNAETYGGGHTTSQSTSEGVTSAPMLVPMVGKEALPPQFRSPEEQLFRYSQFLSAQPDRHAVVRIGIDPPVPITTPTVAPAKISAKGARAWTNVRRKKLPFALPVVEADRRLAARRKQFETTYLGPAGTGEPTNIVRRIKE